MIADNSALPVVNESTVSFDGNHPVFSDHFPGMPLVPAFMQLACVRRHAALLLGQPPNRVVVRSVKFLRPLVPDRSLKLLFRSNTQKSCMQFELMDNETRCTHGELIVG
jgi:3-hydroxymyristoyl/3-hydroxydecanoyl-(acyl carrier protein) dehydratase